MRLYHFTSRRAAESIKADGFIATELHHVLGERLLWLTDDPNARPGALGLSQRPVGRHIRTANRMQVRFTVETDLAMRWPDVREGFGQALAEMLESARWVQPDRWWVSFEPIYLNEDHVATDLGTERSSR